MPYGVAVLSAGWRETCLEVEPGVLKRAGDCGAEDIDKVEAIQAEKEHLSERIDEALYAVWTHIEAGKPIPQFPAWWVFAPELAWTDVISMREAASDLEAVVKTLD